MKQFISQFLILLAICCLGISVILLLVAVKDNSSASFITGMAMCCISGGAFLAQQKWFRLV